jgi:hypothetical protein
MKLHFNRRTVISLLAGAAIVLGGAVIAEPAFAYSITGCSDSAPTPSGYTYTDDNGKKVTEIAYGAKITCSTTSSTDRKLTGQLWHNYDLLPDAQTATDHVSYPKDGNWYDWICDNGGTTTYYGKAIITGSNGSSLVSTSGNKTLAHC